MLKNDDLDDINRVEIKLCSEQKNISELRAGLENEFIDRDSCQFDVKRNNKRRIKTDKVIIA